MLRLISLRLSISTGTASTLIDPYRVSTGFPSGAFSEKRLIRENLFDSRTQRAQARCLGSSNKKGRFRGLFFVPMTLPGIEPGFKA